jgi:perosamine synthetase
MIPYGKQSISEEDIKEVVKTLKSDFITTGPKVSEFEAAVAKFSDAKLAIAVSNGTAALHCAMYAIGIQDGDEVIVPAMTFAASANCIRYCGGTPVFADCRDSDLLIDPEDVERKITDNTKAVIAVDYAGQPCDYDSLNEICKKTI